MDKWKCRFYVDKRFHPGQVQAAAAVIKIEQRQPLIYINSNRNSWKPKTNLDLLDLFSINQEFRNRCQILSISLLTTRRRVFGLLRVSFLGIGAFIISH
jgi:hypothetical protein